MTCASPGYSYYSTEPNNRWHLNQEFLSSIQIKYDMVKRQILARIIPQTNPIVRFSSFSYLQIIFTCNSFPVIVQKWKKNI